MASIEANQVNGAAVDPAVAEEALETSVNAEDELKEAMQLFSAGKRHHLVGDFQSAADSLSESCAIYSKHYGDMGIECAEPLLFYGKSLLELSRVESGVIDNGLKGVPEDDECDDSQVEDPEKCSEEEKNEVKKVVDEALDENFAQLEELQSKNSDNEKAKTNGAQEEEADSEEPEESNPEGEAIDEQPTEDHEEKSDSAEPQGPEGEAVDEQPTEDQEEEEPTNIQLAWENVELAKTILMRHLETLPEDSDRREDLESKLCEAFSLLGEIAIEDENFKQAVDDLAMCLTKRQARLAKDSRCVAESFYQLGVALTHDKQFKEAIDSFNSAILVLQQRIANLKEGKASQEPGASGDSTYTVEKEIEEIETLIPEIREKIDDVRDLEAEEGKKSGGQDSLEELGEKENARPKVNGTAINSTVGDINHLLKKRKKSGDDALAEEEPSKRPHVEAI